MSERQYTSASALALVYELKDAILILLASLDLAIVNHLLSCFEGFGVSVVIPFLLLPEAVVTEASGNSFTNSQLIVYVTLVFESFSDSIGVLGVCAPVAAIAPNLISASLHRDNPNCSSHFVILLSYSGFLFLTIISYYESIQK